MFVKACALHKVPNDVEESVARSIHQMKISRTLRIGFFVVVVVDDDFFLATPLSYLCKS